jgi:hypothetical protein
MIIKNYFDKRRFLKSLMMVGRENMSIKSTTPLIIIKAVSISSHLHLLKGDNL